jgi:hypothetical protein
VYISKHRQSTSVLHCEQRVIDKNGTVAGTDFFSISDLPPSRFSASIMAPPLEQDAIMGPPPVPPHYPEGVTPDVGEKYRKLKRRYFELEEVRASSFHPIDL